MIAKTAEDIGDEAARQREEDLLVGAKELDPARFYVGTRELRYLLDPDGAVADANRAHKRRSLDILQMFDGFYSIDGRLDAEGGAIVQTALNALSAPAAGDQRHACQRRADGLVELARRQLDGGALPEVAGERPHVTVTASVETLAATPGHPAGDLKWGLPIPADRQAAGVRCRPDPSRADQRWPTAGCRADDADGAAGDPKGPGHPRPGLPLPGL